MYRFISLILYYLVLNIAAQGQENILFVGNSLSYSNEMPSIVEEIAESLGINAKIFCLCKSNFAIIDHVNSGELQQLIEKEVFQYVIIQQGPSSTPYGLEMLIEGGREVNNLISSKGIKALYLTVWPSIDRYSFFENVIENHRIAAEKNGFGLIPAGKYWEQLMKDDSTVGLYSSDFFHPSERGSFLVALSIVKSLNPEINLSVLPKRFNTKYVNNIQLFKKMIASIKP